LTCALWWGVRGRERDRWLTRNAWCILHPPSPPAPTQRRYVKQNTATDRVANSCHRNNAKPYRYFWQPTTSWFWADDTQLFSIYLAAVAQWFKVTELPRRLKSQFLCRPAQDYQWWQVQHLAKTQMLSKVTSQPEHLYRKWTMLKAKRLRWRLLSLVSIKSAKFSFAIRGAGLSARMPFWSPTVTKPWRVRHTQHVRSRQVLPPAHFHTMYYVNVG